MRDDCSQSVLWCTGERTSVLLSRQTRLRVAPGVVGRRTLVVTKRAYNALVTNVSSWLSWGRPHSLEAVVHASKRPLSRCGLSARHTAKATLSGCPAPGERCAVGPLYCGGGTSWSQDSSFSLRSAPSEEHGMTLRSTPSSVFPISIRRCFSNSMHNEGSLSWSPMGRKVGL